MVCVNVTVPEQQESVGGSLRLTVKTIISVRPEPYLHASRLRDRLFGITGVIVVAAILGLSVYCVLRFLL